MCHVTITVPLLGVIHHALNIAFVQNLTTLASLLGPHNLKWVT